MDLIHERFIQVSKSKQTKQKHKQTNNQERFKSGSQLFFFLAIVSVGAYSHPTGKTLHSIMRLSHKPEVQLARPVKDIRDMKMRPYKLLCCPPPTDHKFG